MKRWQNGLRKLWSKPAIIENLPAMPTAGKPVRQVLEICSSQN